jgi:hypothetical protein
MKKLQILTLIAVIALVFSCKEEDEIIGYTFTYENFSRFLGSTPVRSFLFLFNENGEQLQDREATNSQTTTLTAEKDGKYNVGVFQEGTFQFFDSKKSFSYNLVHQIPSGRQWGLLSKEYSLRNSESNLSTNITIENLPNFDSLYTKPRFFGSNPSQPIYDATKKQLTHTTLLAFLDYAYICIREHKDSSFRYELIKSSTNGVSTISNFKFDYAKLRKAKVIEIKPKNEIIINQIIASTDKGYFLLYDESFYWTASTNTSIIMPEEKINSYYVQASTNSNNNSITFYTKIDDLNDLTLPALSKIDVYPQTNGTNLYKIAGEKPTLIENFLSKINSNSRLEITEYLPYENDNSINRPIASIPKIALDNFKDLKNLEDSYSYLTLHSFKDKTIDYQTFLNKLFEKSSTYEKFNTWAYDVGWIINHNY